MPRVFGPWSTNDKLVALIRTLRKMLAADHLKREATENWSRSDLLNVAVGFNPREEFRRNALVRLQG